MQETSAPSTSEHKYPQLEGAEHQAGHGDTTGIHDNQSRCQDAGMQVGMLQRKGQGCCAARDSHSALGLEISSGKRQAGLGTASGSVLSLAQLSL